MDVEATSSPHDGFVTTYFPKQCQLTKVPVPHAAARPVVTVSQASVLFAVCPQARVDPSPPHPITQNGVAAKHMLGNPRTHPSLAGEVPIVRRPRSQLEPAAMVGAAPHPERVGTVPPETSNAPCVETTTDIEEVFAEKRGVCAVVSPITRPATLNEE